MILLSYEGVDDINKIDGIKLLGFAKKGDCKYYAIGNKSLDDITPGILNHDGNPKPREIIIYGSLLNPRHMGIWQEDGTVISQWGDNGPIIRHRWNQVIPDYGKYAFFSTYYSTKFPPKTL